MMMMMMMMMMIYIKSNQIKSFSGYNGVLTSKVMSPASVSVQNSNRPNNRSPQRAFQGPYSPLSQARIKNDLGPKGPDTQETRPQKRGWPAP